MRSTASVLSLVAFLVGCASDILLPAGGTRARAGDPLPAGLRERAPEPVALANPRAARIGAYLFEEPNDYGTLMISGGNAMGRRNTAWYTRFTQGHGYRIMVLSFQGYDDNGGDASLGSLLGDARAVHDEIARRFPGEPVAYLASSISTAPALCMPSQEPELAGVILEGAINLNTIPFQKMGQLWYFLPLFPITLPYASFVSLSIPGELRASRCARNAGQVPALFLHHRRDAMTAYGSARRLYEKYAGPKRFEHFEAARNARFHLLLAKDPAAQTSVVRTAKKWLARP